MDNLSELYRAAESAYKRLIGKSRFYLKDDLIQEAVLFLLAKRAEYDAEKAAYQTWAKKVATNYMRDLLDKQKRHFRNPSIFDEVENNITFEDILAAHTITPYDELRYHAIAKTIAPLFANKNARDRAIISMHLKHYTQKEIAWKTGISQPYVSMVVRNFRKAAAILLGVDLSEYKSKF